MPFEVRCHNGDEQSGHGGSLELIKVKILTIGGDDCLSAIRMELSSEVDLFFHYQHLVDDRTFPKIQETQKLMVDLSDYPAILVRMLNACIKEPHINLGIFTMVNDSEARLDFIQNMEYKFVELMYCICVRSPEDSVQQHITYRYNSMKQKLSVMQARLHEINNLVKIKNPSLLLQLQKTSVLPATHTLTSAVYGNSTNGAGGGSFYHGASRESSNTSVNMGNTMASSGSSVGAGSIGVFQKPFR